MIDEQRIKEYFTAEVHARMDELNLRPYHMSYYCQIKHNSVYGYLNGAMLPNPFSLVLMAEHLECCVDELLGYELCSNLDAFESIQASKMFSDRAQYAVCLGDRLRRYMTRRNITAEDLSSKSGVSLGLIKRWTGRRPSLPRTTELLKVVDALGCTPSELLGY